MRSADQASTLVSWTSCYQLCDDTDKHLHFNSRLRAMHGNAWQARLSEAALCKSGLRVVGGEQG
jgi:hypothetical protein